MMSTSPTSSAVARLLLAAAFLALLGLSACASVAPVVKVGLVAPFEGRDRAIGYDAIYSARLAVREINAAGGINGTRVAVVALDDSGDETLAEQAAATLGIDPGVVAVVGHYLPETTAAAAPVYERDGLALLVMGGPPFAASDPAALPPAFRQAYEAVSPFDEMPGPYAGPTYDAFNLLWSALAQAEQTDGISRTSVQDALAGIEYEGVTGNIQLP